MVLKNYQLSIFMVVLLVTASANSLSAEIISHSSKNRVEGSYIVKLTEESIDSFMPDKRLKDYTQSERSKAINSRSVEISSMYGGEVNHQQCK